MDKELITAAFDAVVCIFDAMEGIGSRGGAQGRHIHETAGNCFENIYSLKEKPNCKIVTKVNF